MWFVCLKALHSHYNTTSRCTHHAPSPSLALHTSCPFTLTPNPKQEIELEAHCVKGAGREHAKWSPVATAWYRLHPEVALLDPNGIAGADAEELAAAAGDVFGVDAATGRAFVKDVRSPAAERQLERVRRLLGDDKWAGRAELRKRKDHFIFTVESTGALAPDALVRQALAILVAKAEKLERRL